MPHKRKSFYIFSNTQPIVFKPLLIHCRCCVGSYLRLHTRVFYPNLIRKLNEIFIRFWVWSTVQHVKILSYFIRWLDYYHRSKILVWNLLVWSYSLPQCFCNPGLWTGGDRHGLPRHPGQRIPGGYRPHVRARLWGRLSMLSYLEILLSQKFIYEGFC